MVGGNVVNLRKITAIASVFATTLPALIAAPVFAEESSSTTTDPAVELTAGKDSDKEAKVSKGDQALTDNSKSKDKESDKNTTVLKKEETKAPETTEPPKKEEAKPQEKPTEKVPEKLPEAGFETIGAGLLGASFIGAGAVAVAKRKAKRQ